MSWYEIIEQDIIQWLQNYEGERFHAILSDPPYALISVTKRFGKECSAPAQEGADGRYSRLSGGFMNQVWDSFESLEHYREWVKTWAKLLIEKALYPGAVCLFFGGCYDEETELLTKRGWIKFADVIKTDYIMTLNPKTDKIEYHLPIEIVKQQYKGPMYRLLNNKVDLYVTHDHWVYSAPFNSRHKSKRFCLRTAKEIAGKHVHFKKDGIWLGKDQKHFILPSCKKRLGGPISRVIIEPSKMIPMKKWLKFFGLWIAEGSASKIKAPSGYSYRASIAHFDIQNLNEIKDELVPWFNMRIYPKYGKANIYGRQIYEYLKNFGHASDKYIPDWLKELTPELIRLFLEWYRRGDGDKNRFRLYTSSTKLADGLQELALKAGWSADVYVRNKRKPSYINGRQIIARHPQFVIAINVVQNQPHKNPHKTKIEEWVDYDGDVYCVEVPNHIIYVRRGGKAVWCGNTRTWHHLALGLEQGGFEIFETLMWLTGQGFPKSFDISKGIDRAAGKERSVVRTTKSGGYKRIMITNEEAGFRPKDYYPEGNKFTSNDPITPEAIPWRGYGSALKPAWNPILLCRTPRKGATFASLALEHGSGSLNIDGGRLGYKSDVDKASATPQGKPTAKSGALAGGIQHGDERTEFERPNLKGRWPANLLLSHHEDCVKIGTFEVPARVINRWLDGMKPFGDGAGGEYESVHPTRKGEASADRTYEDEGGTDFAMKPGARRDKEMETVERWACVPECPIRQLDDQAGANMHSAGVARKSIRKADATGMFNLPGDGHRYGDTGGPARFFYCGKASRAEKDKGLEEFYWRRTGKGFERVDQEVWAKLELRERARGCIHPTVKPLGVCRYLATLILPPKQEDRTRRILIPFSGSGSEIIAARQAGWDLVVGIEMKSLYNELSRARISANIGMF